MWDGQAFNLTRMQYRVLALLAAQAREVVPRTQLRRSLSLPETHTRALDVHIHGLRRKNRRIRRPHRNGPPQPLVQGGSLPPATESRIITEFIDHFPRAASAIRDSQRPGSVPPALIRGFSLSGGRSLSGTNQVPSFIRMRTGLGTWSNLLVCPPLNRLLMALPQFAGGVTPTSNVGSHHK
jgi:Transcriptional regulatory protein, C terminal